VAAGRTGAGPSGSAPGPVVVQSCHDLVLHLLQRIEKLARAQIFTVGDRLAEAAMDVLEELDLVSRRGCGV